MCQRAALIQFAIIAFDVTDNDSKGQRARANIFVSQRIFRRIGGFMERLLPKKLHSTRGSSGILYPIE